MDKTTPITVADIMTTRLIKLTPDARLHDAHEITRAKGIRHLPVVEQQSNKLVALVTQKDLIANVVRAIALYGTEDLLAREKSTSIMEVAQRDFMTVNKDQPLLEIAQFFLDNRHGCLPVVDKDDCIIGIITSSDFVKLSVRLLSQTQNKG